MTEPLIEAREIVKIFGGTTALGGVSLQVARGEIVALLGHNGSGKSTLVKLLDGLWPPHEGSIDLHSTTVHVIHQTLGLIDTLSAMENLDVVRRGAGRLLAPFRPAQERARIQQQLRRFAVDLDPSIPVGRLTAAQRTIVAIVRALDDWGGGDHVLVLDEPTATLHDDETAVLLDAVRAIAADGVGVIYISHRLDEVIDLADRAVVLRNGRVAAEYHRNEYSHDDLLSVIAGALLDKRERRTADRNGKVVLKVQGLIGPEIRGVSLDVRAGEVLGIAGVLGSGMEHLNSLIFGAVAPTAGSIEVGGIQLQLGRPHRSIAAGLGYLPPERLTRAGIAEHTARENLTLPLLQPLRSWHGAIGVAKETTEAERWMERVSALPVRSSHHRLHSFSGGNQQKVLLAKWMRLRPAVLLLDEPTQGVDVGAQSEIHTLLRSTADDGGAVVVASSDTHELVELCDRVLVIQDGRVHRELRGDSLEEHTLVEAILDSRADTKVKTPDDA